VIAERLHPQDRDQVRELLARRGDDGDPPNHEARVVYRDGSEHIVHSAAALDPAEQGGMITGFVRDVTAERVAQEEATRSARSLAESESMLRAIVENAGEGITLLDLSSMRYVFVSPRMVEMTGFTMEELNALTADDGVFKRGHPDERDAAREQLRQIASGVVESGLAEYRWKVKNGEYRWFSDNRRLLRDPGGRPRALVAVMTDITVRKQIEAELRKGQEDYRTLLEAERAAQEEHQHVARDLHDAVAQNVFSASLLAEALPAIFRETPDKALDDLVLIRRLIRAVFAELRFLLFELRPETLAVDSMATLLERLGDVLAAKADLTVDLCVDEDLVLSPTSRAVCYHIAQEALNNVGRYAKAQHVVISLAREGQAMRLDVRDDGRGFNEDDCLEGVGMSIMREHARSIDGELTVASTLDVGTTVTLRWREPAQDAPD
jgi:PAS domain S-box-containing protein